jgi:hypothetical protein
MVIQDVLGITPESFNAVDVILRAPIHIRLGMINLMMLAIGVVSLFKNLGPINVGLYFQPRTLLPLEKSTR